MTEVGDRDALRRYVVAHVAHERAQKQIEDEQKRMIAERAAAMRYLQQYGATEIILPKPDGALLARLQIQEPGIEVL